MDTWYSLDLGDGVQAFPRSQEIMDAFFWAFTLPGQPDYMAAFSRYDLKANMVTVYFTPASHSIAEAFNTTPCEKPSSDDLSLLVGDFRCWEQFFPDRIKCAIERRRSINH